VGVAIVRTGGGNADHTTMFGEWEEGHTIFSDIGGNEGSSGVVKADVNPQFQRAHQIESAPDEQSLLRALGGVQPVERAMVAALAVFFRRIGTQAGIA